METPETLNKVADEPPRVLNPETTRSVDVALPNEEMPEFFNPTVVV